MDKEMFEFNKNAVVGNISAPLCAEYKAAWRKCGNDKEMLVRLALSQQAIPYISHACYKHMGLSKEYILDNFGELINGKRTFEDVEGVQGYTYQLYVGFNHDFTVAADVTCMMWCDNPQITFEATRCPIIYVSNSSDIHVVCDGFNSPKIYLFDDSKVTIEDCDETSDVVIYKYSDVSIVEKGKFCLKEPKVFKKELRL